MVSIEKGYKSRNKPNLNENAKWKQGYFRAAHPEKCLSRENIYRSSWEYSFMRWCDTNQKVVRWASEPIPVNYMNPIANIEYCRKNGINPKDPKNWKPARYWTDFWIEMEGSDGKLSKIFIEIKPFSQTQPPKPLPSNASLKEHKAYNRDAETFLVNSAKWAAAKRYFESKGAKFMVFTEHTLERLGCL